MGTIIPRLTANFVSASEAGKYLYCDGSIYDTAKYPKLYNILGTNQLPDLRNRFLEGTDIGSQIIEAGLPNIRATIGYGVDNPNARSSGGAIYSIRGTGNETGGGNARNGIIQYFSAANYSSIYKDDINTVQPPAITVRYYIRAK